MPANLIVGCASLRSAHPTVFLKLRKLCLIQSTMAGCAWCTLQTLLYLDALILRINQRFHNVYSRHFSNDRVNNSRLLLLLPSSYFPDLRNPAW